MNDYIKREDAIKAIEELPNVYNGWSDAYDKAYIIGTLEEVPKANVMERKRGKWIYPTDIIGFGKCENCNALWDKLLIDNIYFKFCPRCGADMRAKQTE